MAIDWATIVISSMLAVLGYLLVGLTRRLDENTKAQAETAVQIGVLNAIVGSVKEDYRHLQHEIARLDATDEIIRARVHSLANEVTVVRLRADMNAKNNENQR